MSFSIGIVGLPNVGKSTLFQALTKQKVDASNYPFCTIDPNVGVVTVPDERLDKLAKLSESKKVIPTAIEFIDIAGIVKGASKGEGLGNKFLQNIREVDAIAEVVRAFKHDDVTHVHGNLDPEHDKEIIKLELVLADLELAEKRLDHFTSQLKSVTDQQTKDKHAVLTKIVAHLREEHRIITLELTDDEKKLIKQYNFLTIKPHIYIYNINEEEIGDNKYDTEDAVSICAKLESEFADIPESDQSEFLDQLGIKSSGLTKLIQKGYELLNLVTFLTTGPEETRAWTIQKGAKATEAAGVIHTDFETGFIRAEIIDWQELLNAGSWTKAKDLGKIRVEGKEYIVKDGDTVYFLTQ